MSEKAVFEGRRVAAAVRTEEDLRYGSSAPCT